MRVPGVPVATLWLDVPVTEYIEGDAITVEEPSADDDQLMPGLPVEVPRGDRVEGVPVPML